MPLAAVFGGEVADEADDAGFAGSISAHAGKTRGVAHERRGEEERAAAPRQQSWNLVPRGEEGAGEVHVDGLPPTVGGNVRHRAHFADCARIVEGDVEAAEDTLRQRNGASRRFFLAHIARKHIAFAAARGDFRCERFQFSLPARNQHQFRALRGEQLGRRMTDAGACAGYDGDFSVERSHVRSFL